MPDEFQILQNMIRELSETVRVGFAEINARLDNIEKRLTIIEKKIDILNKEMLHMRAEYELLDERLTKLEGGSGIQ